MSAFLSHSRRSDLDWLRVGAFGLLIIFHVGLVYAPFDWHVHSRHTAPWLHEAILITGPWRLTLLFLISGAALRLMSRKLPAKDALRARLVRLVPPALFGIVVLVPPQSFIEAVDKGSWSRGFGAWWLHQFSPEGIAAGVPLNHIWFILYATAYTVVAVALLKRPRLLDRLDAWLDSGLKGWRMLVWPILYLTVVRQGLFTQFGLTNHFWIDWYNHAVSLAAFVFGLVIVARDGPWRTLIRLRWISLAVVAVALPMLAVLEATAGPTRESLLKSFVFAVDQWASIAAILGFAARYLQGERGPVLRYLTAAVFPCYLAHQTILVAAVQLVKPWNLAAAPEAGLLMLITLGGSLLVYEAARRSGPLRILWGLKTEPWLRTRSANTDTRPASGGQAAETV